ncbi:MAG: peptidoglycan-binding protein [Myxococcales bacterium]|nr:peptidoglycan-binding protein [Myxococcales bacterium]
MLKMGDRGPKVRLLQEKLVKLGYEPIKVDGVFGPITRWAVLNLQAMFGYTVDGIVGRGTSRLVDTQVSYGWCVKNENAQLWALKAQGLLSSSETQRHWG